MIFVIHEHEQHPDDDEAQRGDKLGVTGNGGNKAGEFFEGDQRHVLGHGAADVQAARVTQLASCQT